MRWLFLAAYLKIEAIEAAISRRFFGEEEGLKDRRRSERDARLGYGARRRLRMRRA